MKSSCYRCGYFQEKESYCEDIDCTVDPCEPACNYDN